MKIVNPLFDLAFKFMMEKEKYARKVLSVILDQEVVELQVGQQESVWPSPAKQLSYFRLDYKAVIRQADGTQHKVLLEVQKSKSPGDIQRFRNYIGANYMSTKDVDVVTEPPPEYYGSFPLIAIYILGYNMPEIPYMAVRVNRDVVDAVSKKKVKVKSSFIDHLTHEAHIIQVRRLPEKRRSRLEQFLTLFNQAWCTSQEFILELQEVPEEFEDIAMYLQGPLIDEQSRRNLAFEKEIRDILDSRDEILQKHKGLIRKIAEAKNEIEETQRQKEEAQRQKEEAQRQKEEAEKKKNEIEAQKIEAEKRANQAVQHNKDLVARLVLFMRQRGASTEDIARETGLSADEVESIKP
ncbi:MAG: hypothetical protein EA394_03240 [Bacteroidia bacterium]|nr:MAG: hypothetical protein EA394_03240 [Bacteroidia bacterium]